MLELALGIDDTKGIRSALLRSPTDTPSQMIGDASPFD